METITEHFLIYQFVYIFFFISVSSILFTIFTKKKTLKLMFLIIFSLFLAIGFIELMFALKIKANIVSLDPPKNTFILANRSLHTTRQIHVIEKNGQKRKHQNIPPNNDEIVIYDYVARKYDNEFRFTKCNLNSNENYVFLGCSFVAGEGLNDDQTLPYYFSKQMNFEKNVLNCGISGRGTNLAISIMESDIINKFVGKDSQTKYFIYSLIDDHIIRNFRIMSYKSMPRDNWLYKNGKFEKINQPFGIVKNMFARSYIFDQVFSNMIDQYKKQYYEDYMIKSLNLLQEIAETKYKSKFIVIVWPKFKDNPVFIDKLRKTNLNLIFLPQYFNYDEYKIKEDWHPNAKANEELANILMNYINKKENKN